MTRSSFIIFCFVFIMAGESFAQPEFIRTKEGSPILNRRQLITNCLKSMKKDKRDETALTICECRIDKMDRYFTKKQYRKYTNNRIIGISEMIKEDSLFEKEMELCFTASGKTILLQAEGFEDEFVSQCISSIQKNTEKKLDSIRLKDFCNCQLDMVKTKKISDAEMQTLNNPNSLLFYEIMYKCGDPFLNDDISGKNWSRNSEKDITGPLSDTLKILSLNGMTYLKMKTGTMSLIWLFDTGASDLLINKDMETEFKKEKIITAENYLGIGQYEMANGMIDTCRKYSINNIQIGKFSVNNVIVAVTDKGKRIIVGRALLNKFSNWILDNRDNTFILNK